MGTRILPVVHVSGSHLEMGQQIGEACRGQVKNSIFNARKLLEDAYEELQLTWDGAQIQARKYIPFAEERYPQYIEELKGIAQGANVSFDEVAVVNAMEAVTSDALHLTKCTSMAVNQTLTNNGHVLVAHNEDWVPEDEGDVFLINARLSDEPPFLALTYGCLLPNIGFNAYGIAQCCDTVYPNDCRIGIPRIIVSRAILASRNLSDAMRKMLAPQRAAGYNHLLAHESGELYNIEVSARKFAFIYGEDGFLAHTNHYLDHQMKVIEHEPDELVSSRIRYFRAIRLLKETSCHSLASIQTIQKDHVNQPDSICNHALIGDPLDRECTIAALIMDLTERRVHACWGCPCENVYHEYELDA